MSSYFRRSLRYSLKRPLHVQAICANLFAQIAWRLLQTVQACGASLQVAQATVWISLTPSGKHAPTKQPRQPFLSQSAMRASHVLACNGVRLTSQLKWRKVGQPARVIPCIDCAMLSQYFAHCTDSTIGSYNITVLNCYNCLFIYLLLTDNGVWLSANSAS